MKLARFVSTVTLYIVGDTIAGNCTSYHTKPAASLMFYINEEKVRMKPRFLLSEKDHFFVF